MKESVITRSSERWRYKYGQGWRPSGLIIQERQPWGNLADAVQNRCFISLYIVHARPVSENRRWLIEASVFSASGNNININSRTGYICMYVCERALLLKTTSWQRSIYIYIFIHIPSDKRHCGVNLTIKYITVSINTFTFKKISAKFLHYINCIGALNHFHD